MQLALSARRCTMAAQFTLSGRAGMGCRATCSSAKGRRAGLGVQHVGPAFGLTRRNGSSSVAISRSGVACTASGITNITNM